MRDSIPEAIQAELTDRHALEQLIEQLGGKVKGNNCRCPFHDDSKPSATITRGDDKVWRFKCHDASCGVWGNILDLRERAGLGTVRDAFKAARDSQAPSRAPTPTSPPDDGPSYATLEELVTSYGKVDATYKYTYPDSGRVDLVVLRIPEWNRDKDRLDKTFRQAHQRPDGRWVKKKPDGLLPIYNRSRLRAADWCLVVEGEKCVHALADIDIVATTSPMGAGKAIYADWTPLRGKRVYLWPDNDPIKSGRSKGHDHMHAVAEILQGLDCRLNLVDPDALGLARDGSDVVDFLAAIAGTMAEKRDAIDAALGRSKPLSAAGELFDRLQACVDGSYRDVGFPWPALTKLNQAFLPGTLTMLCGAPGSTKSYFLLQLLMHWREIGVPVACYMLEHDKAYWLQRCLAMMASISGLVNVEWIRLNPEVAMKAQSTLQLDLERMARLIDIPDRPVSHLDLLTWLDGRSAAGSRILAIDPVTAAAAMEKPWVADLDFVTKAKSLARQRGFSVLLVTHPRTGKGISPLDDLAGGSAFQRFTQTVLVLKSHYPPREICYEGECGTMRANVNRTVIIAKATNGPGSGMQVGMEFNPKTLRFNERGIVVEE
jgi:hypothetical protein